MKRKTLAQRRVATPANRTAKPSDASIRKIPLLATQDEDNAALPQTSIESDHGLRDDRIEDSNDSMAQCMEENCNKSPHDIDYIYLDLMDKKICITCNKSGEVLVCSESDCPVALHAKCIHCEPKFDDKGNFYCPYCWYKRAVAELQELRKNAMISKKALSNFLDKNILGGDKLVKKLGAAKRKELKELFLAGDGSCLDGYNKQENDGVHSQPLQAVGDQHKRTGRAAANADQQEMAVEGETHANASATNPDRHEMAVEGETHAIASAANAEDLRNYREGKPIHIEMVHNSMNRKKINVQNISRKYETRSVKVKEKTEPEAPRHNNEEAHERIAEDGMEAKPLGASHLGKYTDGHSPDIAFAKGMQESLAVSADYMDRMEIGEKFLPNKLEVSATGSSVSQTIDSDPETHSVKKRRVRQRAQKTTCPLNVAPVRAILYQEIETVGKNACNVNEEVATSETLRKTRGSSKQVKSLTLMSARRRRLNWTAEEENMLKEGVLKFSMENKNIPWRKILEYGVHVFDPSRTPVDLKDKWKNMTAKEGWR